MNFSWRHQPRIILAEGGRSPTRRAITSLLKAGWQVILLTRHPLRPQPEGVVPVYWDGRRLNLWTLRLEGASAILNLAGEAPAGRLTPKRIWLWKRSGERAARVLKQARQQCYDPPMIHLQAGDILPEEANKPPGTKTRTIAEPVRSLVASA